jgi:hypothetical protein
VADDHRAVQLLVRDVADDPIPHGLDEQPLNARLTGEGLQIPELRL